MTGIHLESTDAALDMGLILKLDKMKLKYLNHTHIKITVVYRGVLTGLQNIPALKNSQTYILLFME